MLSVDAKHVTRHTRASLTAYYIDGVSPRANAVTQATREMKATIRSNQAILGCNKRGRIPVVIEVFSGVCLLTRHADLRVYRASS